MLNAPIEKAGGWGGGDQENKLRLIHTRRSSLHFPQWAASMQRQEIFYLPSEMQPSATDARRKCSNVNEPLDRKRLHRSKRRKRGRFESWKANNHRTYVSSTNEKNEIVPMEIAGGRLEPTGQGSVSVDPCSTSSLGTFHFR